MPLKNVKRGLSYAICMSAIAFFLLFSSCNKSIFSLDHFPDPLTGAGESKVATYYLSEFDPTFPKGINYLFTKNYDATGKNVKEIKFFIAEDAASQEILGTQSDYQIVDKGRKVFLITKDGLGHGIPDTSAIIYLNTLGRPDSIVSYSRITLHFDARAGETVKTYFSYKQQRLFTARTVNTAFLFLPM